MDEIARLTALQGSEINEAKKILANEATALCRGVAAAELAAETARRTFEEGAADANLPTVALSGPDMTVMQAVTGLGFAASNKEVKRKVAEGAIRINDVAVSDPATPVAAGDKVSFGAKKHGLIVD